MAAREGTVRRGGRCLRWRSRGEGPPLAAHGAEDVVVPPPNLDALTEAWPRCRADLLGGCGHALMAQEPETLADLISSFLRG